MSLNLLEKTREILGYPTLKKIDADTQDVKSSGGTTAESQAILPAVMAGIYSLSKSDEGLQLLCRSDRNDWASILFPSNKEEVINNIATYASMEPGTAEQKVNDTASVAVRVLNENTDSKSGDKLAHLKTLINNQRSNFVAFIPSALNIGNLLDHTSMDDRTNKMQGPVSTFMHKLADGFSSNDTDEEIEKKSNNF